MDCVYVFIKRRKKVIEKEFQCVKGIFPKNLRKIIFFLLLKKEIHVIKIYDKKKEFKIEN